ncbi:MAG: DUF1320 family protein [Spirochaetota bacterium]|nr:DUF1320 family protein [Spirochaetota bacterium]
MLYCHKEDLFEACLQSAIESWAKNDCRESSEMFTPRIISAISRSSEEMNLYICKQHSLPLPFIPLSLRDICVKLSLYQLLSRKGFTEDSADYSIKVNRDSAIKQLEQIATGKLDIGIISSGSSPVHPSYYFPKSPLVQNNF